MYWIVSNWRAVLALSIAVLCFFLGWKVNGNRWELKHQSYVEAVERAAREQEVKTEGTIREQGRVNKAIKNEYEAKLSAIKSYYGRVFDSPASSSTVSPLPDTPKGVDESSKDLVLDCAITTQQLTSLQQWVSEQGSIHNGD